MAYFRGPNLVTNGLVFCLDAANPKSYVGNGLTWSDISLGSTFSGTLFNGVSFTSSYYGNMDFDGSSAYGSFGSNSITGTAPLTIGGWLNVRTHSTFGIAAMIGNGNTGQMMYIGYSFNNSGGGVSNTIGGGLYGSNFGSGVSASTGWHDVVITFSGGSGATFSMYVDGSLKLTASMTPNILSTSIYLGKANTGTQYYYNGSIGGFRVYNRCLSSSEVLQNYFATKSRYNL